MDEFMSYIMYRLQQNISDQERVRLENMMCMSQMFCNMQQLLNFRRYNSNIQRLQPRYNSNDKNQIVVCSKR